MSKEINTYIGCDPSFRNGGMAIFIYDAITKEYSTMIFKNLRHFQKYIDGLEEEKPPQLAVVGVEDSGDKEIVYEAIYKNFLQRSGLKDSKSVRNKYAISVGKNIAATNYAISLFSEKYKPRRVIKITPLQKGEKLTERGLLTNYGIELKGSEQDERDAAVICLKAKQRYLFNQKAKQASK